MKKVLAIDPGSGKCGIAVVQGQNKTTEILERAVTDIKQLPEKLKTLCNAHRFDFAVVGNGTNTKQVQEILRSVNPGLSMLLVDEKDTTIRAREKYWEHTPRRGWRRFLPSSLQVPPVAYDDYVAVILAERALHVE